MSEPLPHDYQTVPVVPVRHFACLACGEHLFHVEHLFRSAEQYDKGDGYSAGPWYCDECGTANELRMYADGRVTARSLDKKCLRTSVVLKLPPQKEPVYFLMEGMRFTEEWPNPGETQEEHNHSRDRYFYEEHSCPTNWLKDVQEVMIGSDCDPHGLWHYMGTIEASPSDDSNNKQLSVLLSQLEEKAEQASFDALVNAGVPEEALARMSLRDQIAEKEAELIRRSNLIEEKEREINRLREQIRDTENRR